MVPFVPNIFYFGVREQVSKMLPGKSEETGEDKKKKCT